MSHNTKLSTIKSIAEHDKKIIDLQHLVNLKKTQLRQDYENLLKNVKSNPFLQAGIDEYKQYFENDKKSKIEQIKALKTILNSLDKDNVFDRNEIKREIKDIEQNM